MVVITVLMIILYGKIPFASEPFSAWDLADYQKIALAAPGIAAEVQQPFAYRMLGPYIVGLFPVATPLGFYVFAFLSLVVLAISCYFFLLYVSARQGFIAFFVVSLFVLNKYLFGYLAWNYFQINDTLSLIFIIVLFWAMLGCRWGVFAFVLFIGALTRETVMIMVPVSFFFLLEKKKLRSESKKIVLAVTPGILVFLLLRLFINPVGGLNLFQAFLRHGGKFSLPEAWFRSFINAFIPLSLLPLIFLNKTVSFFKEHRYLLVYLSLVIVSTLFGSNYERLMAPTFIVFYWLITEIIEEYVYPHKTILLLIFVSVFFASFHNTYGLFPLPNKQLTFLFSMIPLLIVSLVVFCHKTKRRVVG